MGPWKCPVDRAKGLQKQNESLGPMPFNKKAEVILVRMKNPPVGEISRSFSGDAGGRVGLDHSSATAWQSLLTRAKSIFES